MTLMDNILELNRDLTNHTYQHDAYQAFNINDPKPREIHKASVRDRLLHRAVYRILYPFFDRTFMADSFSCRIGKGTHKAINRFKALHYKVSKNNTRTCWVLKCDIRKFFENIDYSILINLIAGRINDKNIIWLLEQIIFSFSKSPGRGLPLGNLTSQLFVNIYMNEFDHFIKHKLKAKYYVRYADDFVVLSEDKSYLINLLVSVKDFLQNKLKLSLHPDKVFIKTVSSGVDFLGWVHFPDHRVLRTVTKRRMFKKIRQNSNLQTINSYLGLLRPGNTRKIKEQILIEGLTE